MNARFYSPSSGRFITADTIIPDPQNPQTYNRYAYVYNNPLNLTDPSGHAGCSAGNRCVGNNGPISVPSSSAASSPMTVNVADENSDWHSGSYSSCTMCHAATAYGQTVLTNSQLAAYDSQLRETGYDTSRIVEPIDWVAQGFDCAFSECNPEQVYLMMMPFMSGGMYDEFASLGDEFVSSRSIRYTQDSISPATQKGLYLDDLTGSMAVYGWSGAPLNVAEIEGVLYSLDHRRLVAAQIIGIDVPITVLDLSNPDILAEFTKKSSGLRAGTQGLYIDVRKTGIRIHTDGTIDLSFA